MNFLSLSHPFRGALLRQPEQTNPGHRILFSLLLLFSFEGTVRLMAVSQSQKVFLQGYEISAIRLSVYVNLVLSQPHQPSHSVSNWFLSIARGNLNPLEQIQLPWLPFGLTSPKLHPPTEQTKAVGHLTDVTVSHQGELPLHRAEFRFSKAW